MSCKTRRFSPCMTILNYGLGGVVKILSNPIFLHKAYFLVLPPQSVKTAYSPPKTSFLADSLSELCSFHEATQA